MFRLRRNLMHMFVGLTLLAIFLIFGRGITLTFLALLLAVGMLLNSMLKSGARVPLIETFLDVFETEDEEENWRGLGAVTLVLGILLTIFFFSKEVAIPAILVVTISDALSAIGGSYIKSTEILERRTVFGTTSFFVSALLILTFFVPVSFALLIAAATAIIELLPLPDDNIWIPLTAGFLLSLILPFV